MTVCGAVHQQAQQCQAGPAGSYIYMPVLSGIICSNATLVCMTVCGAVHQQAHHFQAGPAGSYIYAGVIWHCMQQRYTGLHDSLWCSPPTSTPLPGWTCGRLFL